MEIKHLTSAPLKSDAHLLAITVYGAPSDDAFVKAADELLGGRLLAQAEAEHFAGKAGQTLICHADDDSEVECYAVALIGAGDKKKADHRTHRDLGANCYKAAKRLKAESLAVVVPPVAKTQLETTTQMVTEGVVLGSYNFSKYFSDEKAKEQPVLSVGVYTDRPVGKKKSGAAGKGIKNAVHKGQVIADATCHARDMINEPAEFMNPSQVAAIARKLAKKHKTVTAKVLSAKECEKLGMGMFLGVGRGSSREPQFIHLTYKPAKKAKKVITFVGKGVTFDSGGYSLKPSAAMIDMKIDMSGCAAVVSAMDAIATLGSPNEVHVITACCENLVSGNAYLLGDVLKGMNGTTVEINNTDAEGRLTLGDALVYAQERTKPDELFDFATLTGACMVALGNHTAGVFTNDDKLGKAWMKSVETAGEDMWQMPLHRRLKSQLKSPIADLKNTGDRWGGAITAALFLEHFVKDTAWVHCDIAGPAATNRAEGATSRGGTGFAVASIVEHALV